MQATLITIGDEILIGQIIDTNSAWMAEKLNHQGIHVKEILSISDEKLAILEAVQRAEEQSDIVLITGGLGPTKDDITKNTLAEYYQMDLVYHEASWTNLVNLFKKFDREAGEEYRWQCNMPEGARVLINEVGTAPGMWFERDGKVVVSMPGVPFEMKFLMNTYILPDLKKRFIGTPILHKTILTSGIGETRLAIKIVDFENNLPSNIKLAYLPNLGGVRLRLSAIGEDEDQLRTELEQQASALEELVGSYVFGFDQETQESALGKLLLAKNLTLATAESCTGGHIGHKITSVPGSSAYFNGGVIAYTNDVKMKVLGVKSKTLKNTGAVSEDTVREMVLGTLDVTDSDVGIAVSGVAGPGGGSPEKPVGTVCIAVGDRENVVTETFKFGRDRLKNIQLTTTVSFNLMRKFLLER